MSRESYDEDRIAKLKDPSAFRYYSGEELRVSLSPTSEWDVAEFGSGTGLFTSELAPVVDTVFAIDIRQRLHNIYQESGMPANVVPLTADFGKLPFPDNALDGGVSIRTYHHGMAETLSELARVIRPDGRLLIMDWSATGAGDREFRRDESYFDLATVQAQLLEQDFRIKDAQERYETFKIVAERR